MNKKYRWVVVYTDKYAFDDWGAGNCREYFDNEKDANNCVKNNTLKGKPFHWQPNMWKEVEVERVIKEWKHINDIRKA